MILIKRLSVILLSAFQVLAYSVFAVAETEPAGLHSCTFDGVKHDYIVDLPEDPAGAGLIVMLHGYGQNAEIFRMDTGFQKDAALQGYVLVWVTGAPDPDDRTSAAGWNYGAHDGGNRDVELLTALVSDIEEQYHTDPERCFAVGFSNGGFMCHRLALEAADTFTAVVSVSGTMPELVWEKRPEECTVGFFQITGEKDDTIPKNSDGSAAWARSPAIEEVIGYYAAANGLDRTVTEEAGKESLLVKYSSDLADRQVWHLIIKDGRHSWSGESVTGISTNRIILDYLNVQ